MNNEDDFYAFDGAPAPASAPAPRQNRNRKNRPRNRVPEHAPQPQDRLPKRLPQQAEVEDAELRITVFGEEFRVRRSEMQDNWAFFAAQAVNNLPGMTVQTLGQAGFIRFCQSAQAAGMKPVDAVKELWEVIGREAGVGDSGN